MQYAPELYERNLRPDEYRLSEIQLKKLDSSLKKNTAFIKKLKTFSDNKDDTLLKEVQGLNLSRYIGEVAQGIVQACLDGKVKLQDIPTAVQLCSSMHQMYREFAVELINVMKKNFDISSIIEESCSQPQSPNTDKSFTRLRVMLKLMTELFVVRVFSDFSPIKHCLQQLLLHPKIKLAGDQVALGVIMTIVMFTKSFGKELMGLEPPQKEGEQAEGEESKSSNTPIMKDLLNAAQKAELIQWITDDYYQLMTKTLENIYKEMIDLRAENEQMIGKSGELTEDQKALFERKKKFMEKYYSNSTSFGELIRKTIPGIPEMNVTSNTSNQNIYFQCFSVPTTTPEDTYDPNDPPPLWDDDDKRAFYEDLPDIESVLPPNIVAGKKKPYDEEKDDKDDDDDEDGKKSKAKGTTTVEADATALEPMFERLKECATKQSIDNWGIEFCTLIFTPTSQGIRNHKYCRKRLIRELAHVPRTLLELIPCYARLAASLTRYLKEIGPNLLNALEAEFNDLFSNKNQIHIESKIKNIRFLGELTKFKICAETIVLRLLSKCLDDFTHHNIDVACHLLESSGAYLYRNPISHTRTYNLIQQMTRLRSIKTLDPRHEMMIDSAIHACKPQESRYKPIKPPKVLTPVQLYIHHLIYENLTNSNLKHTLKQLRKLNWDDPSTAPFVTKTLRRVEKSKSGNVHLMASLTAALASYYDVVAIKIVDMLIEDIRFGIEQDVILGWPLQRRLLDLKLLGELYNYRLLDIGQIFEVLHICLFYASYLDNPADSFRIRMVCTLLEVTMPYFLNTTAARRRLLRFLPYFFRYVLTKNKPLPLDTEFILADLIEQMHSLMPRSDANNPLLLFPESLPEADENVWKLEAKLLTSHRLTRSGPMSVSLVYRLLYGPDVAESLISSVSKMDTQRAIDALRQHSNEVPKLSDSDACKVWPVMKAGGGGVIDKASLEIEDIRNEDDEEEEDAANEQIEIPDESEETSKPMGRFLLPLGYSLGQANRRKDIDDEDKEFEKLMNASILESLDEVKKDNKRTTNPLEKKIGANMALPLNLWVTKMSAHAEGRNMNINSDDKGSDSDEETTPGGTPSGGESNEVMPFAIVLKRKPGAQSTGQNSKDSSIETTVDVKGTKEVVLRPLSVPVDTTLAQAKMKMQEEHKKSQEATKRYVLEYEYRGSEHGAPVQNKGRGGRPKRGGDY